jgi:hypothetical protein
LPLLELLRAQKGEVLRQNTYLYGSGDGGRLGFTLTKHFVCLTFISSKSSEHPLNWRDKGGMKARGKSYRYRPCRSKIISRKEVYQVSTLRYSLCCYGLLPAQVSYSCGAKAISVYLHKALSLDTKVHSQRIPFPSCNTHTLYQET